MATKLNARVRRTIPRLDLSAYRTPAGAVAALEAIKTSLDERERTLLDIQTGETAQPVWPGLQAELDAIQAALRDIEEVWARLTVFPTHPLDTYPASCRPRREAEDRARGHALHKTLAREGIADHYAYASDVLGKEVTHFRLLTKEEVAQVREAVLVRSGRYGPTAIAAARRGEDALPDDIEKTETGMRLSLY